MTDKEFTFWLQGYFEISGATEIDEKSAGIIQDKLQSVFCKRTSEDGQGKADKPVNISPLITGGTTSGGFGTTDALVLNTSTNILPSVC